MKLDFIKMNGSGNDFIIFDARKQDISLSGEQIRQISARNNSATKGCDQLLILRKSDIANVFMQIYNADGSEVDACGNATRCVVDILYKESGKLPVVIKTNTAILLGVKQQDDYILVDMGVPKFRWGDIPLAMPIREAIPKIEELSGLKNPTFVSMGNPHIVYFTDEIPSDAIVTEIGSRIENFAEVFPKRINVSFAKNTPEIIEAKIWERGAGLTKACGTGACAILAAAYKQFERTEAQVKFMNSGEAVHVKLENKHIFLGGRIETELTGIVEI
ncbi:MAG: diaminopimelate epimerase [Pseudomonadota bacterium]